MASGVYLCLLCLFIFNSHVLKLPVDNVDNSVDSCSTRVSFLSYAHRLLLINLWKQFIGFAHLLCQFLLHYFLLCTFLKRSII